MRTITIIEGPHGSGKTTMAKDLSKNKEAFWVSDDYQPIPFEPGVIVLDDTDKSRMLSWAFCDKVRIEPKGKPEKMIDMPDIIFCTQDQLPESLLNSSNVKRIKLS